MRTQTFANGETGLSIRNKLNSIADWEIGYSYNVYDITHYSGSVYSSLINNNVGNIPTGSSFWIPTNQTVISCSWASSSLSASYAPTSPSISASYALSSSYALNGGTGGSPLATGSTYPITASVAISSSYNLVTEINTTSSSFASSSLSASYASIAETLTGNNAVIIGQNALSESIQDAEPVSGMVFLGRHTGMYNESRSANVLIAYSDSGSVYHNGSQFYVDCGAEYVDFGVTQDDVTTNGVWCSFHAIHPKYPAPTSSWSENFQIGDCSNNQCWAYDPYTTTGPVQLIKTATGITLTGSNFLQLKNNDNQIFAVDYSGAITSSAILLSTGSLGFTTSSTAPNNTTNIVQWANVVVAGITYKMPLYQ
jgi:hypothetical protein